MSNRLQYAGLAALTFLALALLYLIGSTFAIIGSHIGPDGRVPSAEAFGLTALLLSFREVVASMKSLWDSQERMKLTEGLTQSTPNQPSPQSATEAASQVAEAASDRADQIVSRDA